MAELPFARTQVIGFRRVTNGLAERLVPGPVSLRQAAWSGLQDSVPRSAVHSLHARVEGIGPGDWEAPALAQVWGPRYTAHVIPAADRAVFTVGRLPTDRRGRERAETMAARLRTWLGPRRRSYVEAGEALGVDPNALRYAAPTGTVLIRWDGARRPIVWTVAAPDTSADVACAELARRYLHVYGPATAAGFAKWAGVSARTALTTFEALTGELAPVAAPGGVAWILAADEPLYRRSEHPAAAARLLPSGDPFFLAHGGDRELLVPDPFRRAELWPSRVWPGAVLIDGEICGSWRRSEATVTISSWRALSASRRAAVEAEARSLPLPDPASDIEVVWAG